MQNVLDFSIPFSPLRQTDFINCFASACMFLEDGGKTGGVAAPCKNGNAVCVGCGVGCNDSPATRQARWFFLFDAMSGASCVRRRYDGKPSEMQRILGAFMDGNRDTDDTVDFLFGFAGYAYHKLTESGAFKAAVVESIDSGKPAIAKVKDCFHVIIGYEGDALLCPDYANAQNRPGTPEYGDIEKLYILGDKGAPRYSLKDGLERIERMMECNEREKIWDGYIDKLREEIILFPDEEFKKRTPEEQKAVMSGLTAAAWCAWTSHNLGQAFASRNHEEMRNPIFAELWEKISERCCRIVDYGHAINYLNGKIDWAGLHASTRSGIGDMLVWTVEKYKAIDAELLDLIRQALGVAR